MSKNSVVMPDVEDSLYGEGEPLCSGQVGQPKLRRTVRIFKRLRSPGIDSTASLCSLHSGPVR
jgi:hypothetical protein